MKYYLEYVNMAGGNDEVSVWIETTLAKEIDRKPVDQTEVEHVLDYLLSDAAPTRLRRMSYSQAKKSADAWSAANQKRGRNIVEDASDVEVLHAFDDGAKIVRLLTKKAFQREGFFMAHCVGSYNPNSTDTYVYSYRDAKNFPHATFEVKKKEKQITQIKGKGNGSIHPRYIRPILAFLEKIGMPVRSREMANLGYYYVPDEVLGFVRLIDGATEQIQVIHGQKYFFWSAGFS